MTRCECRGSGALCSSCEAAIDRALENRLFNDGWLDRDLDDMADAQAAREFYGRGE